VLGLGIGLGKVKVRVRDCELLLGIMLEIGQWLRLGLKFMYSWVVLTFPVLTMNRVLLFLSY